MAGRHGSALRCTLGCGGLAAQIPTHVTLSQNQHASWQQCTCPHARHRATRRHPSVLLALSALLSPTCRLLTGVLSMWATSPAVNHPDKQPLLHPHLPVCRSYTTYEELCEDYASGALHPGDLKPALAKHLNQILQVRRGVKQHVCSVDGGAVGTKEACLSRDNAACKSP